MASLGIVESLFIEPAVDEHVEMYLKAIWLIQEAGEEPARISTVSKLLHVSAPSVVQMLRKLQELGHVKYLRRQGAEMTVKGREVGRRMVRNVRLFEVLMTDKLRIAVDPKVACGVEHHLTEEFSEALCSLLGHPPRCPHGKPIPEGRCCKK